ncbi:hypothetical protein [Nitratireductor sp. ZSWI3]|uniref:hypothetical protein n=1 Tax=Nitratireductor sp. ZSWI3 TaxID=2966359 RepID=UPI00214F912C|nr:hypothetical protein [Nitratireductor sp. ZSWI3]MCR4267836.1 hypothetical protein [Nitratireductor sp. ZSWI3]
MNHFAELALKASTDQAVLRAAALTDAPLANEGAQTMRPLQVAAALAGALDAAGVRYGVLHGIVGLAQGLAGHDDIDLFVDRRDYAAFCAVVGSLHGLRGTSLSCYDNVCAGREDWFLPDFAEGRYLHVDLHVGVRVGWEFRKRYLTLDQVPAARWERLALGKTNLPVARAEDEMRNAVSRLAFGSWLPPWRRWITLRGHHDALWTRLPNNTEEHVVTFPGAGMEAVDCRVRLEDGRLLIRRADLGRLRQAIRKGSGFAGLGIADPGVHLTRKVCYRTLRLLERIRSGSVPPKRRPIGGGLVIAIVGPDGVGKSTQAERLAQVFRWKFGCMNVYAGTGDGHGWWFRKLLGRLLLRRRAQLKSAIRNGDGKTDGRGWLADILAVGLGMWGILIALERHAMVKRAHRWAARGFIVISDRWPQALQRGILDGPMIPPGPYRLPGPAALARREQALYRQMHAMRPHLTVHLIAPHSVSQQRKPGEIGKEAFDARLSLMARLREQNQDIQIVDAGASVEAVSHELFRRIWHSL